MGNLINKIKEFFKNIISKNRVKRLDAPKENLLEKNCILKDSKIKKGQYNLNELTEEQSNISILNSEIAIKKDKLDQDITELNILKIDNRIDEKNRILELYKEIKNDRVSLSDISKEDLLKIRKLLLEESKIQDSKLEDELRLLEMLKKVS